MYLNEPSSIVEALVTALERRPAGQPDRPRSGASANPL